MICQRAVHACKAISARRLVPSASRPPASVTQLSSIPPIPPPIHTRCFRTVAWRQAESVPSSTATSSAASSSSSSPSVVASTPVLPSFIDHVKRHGSESLLGPFRASDRFDSCMAGMEVTNVDTMAGHVIATLPVSNELANSYGTLHGGAITTIVDVMGTMALMAKDHTKAGVSVDLNVNFLSAAKIGETLTCEGRVLRLGRTLGFTQVDIKDSKGKLVATGRHTKAM